MMSHEDVTSDMMLCHDLVCREMGREGLNNSRVMYILSEGGREREKRERKRERESARARERVSE